MWGVGQGKAAYVQHKEFTSLVLINDYNEIIRAEELRALVDKSLKEGYGV